MTLDLSNSFITFYLQGEKPSGALSVALKSHYSNEYLMDGDTQYLVVTPVEWYANWWKAQFTFATADYRDKDIAGFYNFELYANDVLVLTKLTKVINNNGISPNTTFASNDENNEQVIYYR